MNKTKRNEIEKALGSLTRNVAIQLCKNLIAENEELIAENEELKAINRIFALVNGISKVVIERNEHSNIN